ncbi:MAG: GGDEF domain-containing protein [Desulfuromonadaceae bacterium]|nr:GGDEF domain-containing protein [Desulfuromonadaceae bacterium]
MLASADMFFELTGSYFSAQIGQYMILRLHRKIVQTFSSSSPSMILSYCVVLLAFLGWLDVVTGDYSLIVFYLVPVSLAAWFVSKKCGLFFCLLVIVVRVIADNWSRSDFFAHSSLNYWNEFIEFLFLLIMSLLFSALKKNLDNEKNLARRDPLTDTLNRRSFFDLAEHEIKRSQRYDLPLTVAYIDIDNFKEVNDQCGHQAGDELLVAVVSTIRSNVRSMDILARFGGDEFVILLPDTPADAATGFLKKIHAQLDTAMTVNKWCVTFSIGSATYVKVPSSVDTIIRTADELMYAAKHGGKNRLIHKEIGEVEHG